MGTRVALLSWSLALVLAGACLRLLAPIPPLLLIAALVPAACYAGLIVWVGPGKRPPVVLLAMLLWGAVVAAPVSRTLNGVAHAGLVTAADGVWVSPLLAAPIEEVLKATGLLAFAVLWRREFTGILDGIVYAALIGIGFTATENIDYFMLAVVQGGEPGLARSVYVRAGLEGLNHASFAALTGAGVGYAWVTRSMPGRLAWLGGGLGAAILQHALWNTLAAQLINTILCSPAIPSGPCSAAPTAVGLFVQIPLVVAACIGPGVITLAVVAARARVDRGDEGARRDAPTVATASTDHLP